MKEVLLVLDSVRLNFSEGSLFILNITIALIMFGVALEIKAKHFKNIWNNKRYPVIGFISQFLLLPLITFLLLVALNRWITPSIAMGMILVAACPGGNISNFISSLAKGHAALSVTLTAIATIASIVLTPLNFLFWGKVYTSYISMINTERLLQPIEISPFDVFTTIFILVGIPLALGMLFNRFLPKITKKIVKPIKIFSILAFAGMIGAAFSANAEYFVKYIKYVFILVLLHNTLALLTGYFFAKVTRCNESVKRTITIETGIQNSALALVLLFNPKIFPLSLHNGGMAFIAAWWGIWHILSGLVIAAIWSWTASRKNVAATNHG